MIRTSHVVPQYLHWVINNVYVLEESDKNVI